MLPTIGLRVIFVSLCVCKIRKNMFDREVSFLPWMTKYVSCTLNRVNVRQNNISVMYIQTSEPDKYNIDRPSG